MLKNDLERYIAIQHACGFLFEQQRCALEKFVAFAASAGDTFVRASRVLDWSLRAVSPQQRRKNLLTVRNFALVMTAEDPRHEVPSADLLPMAKHARLQPYIYSAAEITSLISCAEKMASRGCPVPGLYPTLFGLIAVTGMRISEVLALNIADITEEGIFIRHAKGQGKRLLPVHPTTSHALSRYLDVRQRTWAGCDAVFLANSGKRLSPGVARSVFLRMLKETGLVPVVTGCRTPRVHDLRHSFAVRSLEACGTDRKAVVQHMVGLSTYLGHININATYWYLEATPALMLQISVHGENYLAGGAL